MSRRQIKEKLTRSEAGALNASTKSSSERSRSEVSRRLFGTGLFVALFGGLLARTTQGFPEGAQNHFNAATRILSRYGLSVGGAFDQTLGHDVLTVTSIPQSETQYDFVEAEVNAAGGINPCWKTSSFQASTDFTAFDENQAGGIVPCTKTTVAGEQTIFEQLDTNQAGGIVPCSRTIIEESLTVHKLFDPNVAGGIDPCWIAESERLADGRLGPVEVVVNDPSLTERMLPSLRSAAGAANVSEQPRTTTSEDFSRYAMKVPGMMISLGVTARDKDPAKAAANHSPLFEADESALPVGIRVMSTLALDYLGVR